MADGEVRIDVDTEIGKAEKALAKLTAALNTQETKLKELQAQYQKLSSDKERAFFDNKTIDETNTKITQLKNTYNELLKSRSTLISQKAIDLFGTEKAGKAEKIRSAVETGAWGGKTKTANLAKGQLGRANIDQKNFEIYTKYVSDLNEKLSTTKTQFTGLEQDVKVFSDLLNVPNKEQEKLNTKIDSTKTKYDAAKEAVEQQKTALDALYAKKTDSGKDIIDTLHGWEKVKYVLETMGKTTLTTLGMGFKALGRIGIHVFNGIIGSALKLSKTLLSGFKNILTNPLKNLSKKFSSFGKRLNTAILQGLIFRPIRTSLTNLLNMYKDLMEGNSQVYQSFAQVKGAAITAFQPLLTTIVPIIQTVCNWIIKLIQYISALISILFGVGKASKSAAKSLYAQGQAATSAGKSNDKFLASWDTIQQAKSTEGGGGSGSGITPDFNFADTDFSSQLDDLKKKIDAQDWEGIGKEISEKLNGVLSSIDTWVTSVLYPKTAEYTKNLSNLLNGIISGIDPVVHGKLFADILNTIINDGFIFLSTFDFSALGSKLADIINNVFYNVNWEELGKTISLSITNIYDFMITFISTLDFSKIGSSIGTLLSNIDWGTIMFDVIKYFVVVATGAIDGLIGFIENLDLSEIETSIKNGFSKIFTDIDWNKLISDGFKLIGELLGLAIRGLWDLIIKPAIEDIRGWWKDHAYEDGKFTLQGLLDGIDDGLKSIGTWIKDHIFTPFINGFKSIFGISSPSKVMAEQGKYIGQGLLNGIDTVLSTIGNWIKTHIFDPIWNNIISVFGIDKTGTSTKMQTAGTAIANGLSNGIGKGIGAVKSVLNSIISAVETAVNWIISKLNTISWKVPSWVPFVGGKQWGFNISNISLPRLEQGAVVNPGHEFQAILGDNRHEQEIVSPISLMKEALMEALSESKTGTQNDNIYLQIDGRTFAKLTSPYIQKESARVGISVT